MLSLLRKWILARVIRSAMVFEKEAIAQFRRLKAESAGGPMVGGIEHLLAEEEVHWRILGQAAEGRLDGDELLKLLGTHIYSRFAEIQPLEGEELRRWGGELSRALEREKEAFIFYGNLRRISKIPIVKKAFEVLASMEKEHVDILSKLLGRVTGRSRGSTGQGQDLRMP
jgi:rubrerythrin